MDVPMMFSMAGNLLAAIAMAVLAAKLADARLDRSEAEEASADLRQEVADLKTVRGSLELINGQMLTELTDYRANAEKVRAGALRASAAAAAKRKNGVAAH